MDTSSNGGSQHHANGVVGRASAEPRDTFPTDPTGLPQATGPAVVELADGDMLDLRIGPVAKQLDTNTVRMLGFNGSIPGPILKVGQGSEVMVHVTNDGDLDTTVHWHGLRLDNRYDGVPHETQMPIPVGGDFSYRIRFPDPGVYWYHPHIREDYAQEMGLYGTILVDPAEPDYWPPAHCDVVLTLDDVLIEDGKIVPFSVSETTHTAMGRFGNLLLVSGEPHLALTAKTGEVLRLWLTNTANTRVFNVRAPGALMKLVGGDSGRVEHEQFVSEVLLAPSERVVVDLLADRPGQLTLEHRTPHHVYLLASITVTGQPAAPPLRRQFHVLRHAPDLASERQQLAGWLAAPPDKVLALVAEMSDLPAPEGPVVYTCPMHPDVSSQQPGRCPNCGMKLVATEAAPTTYACPMHPEVASQQPGRCPTCGMKLLAVQPGEEPSGHVMPTAQHSRHGHEPHGNDPAEPRHRDDHEPHTAVQGAGEHSLEHGHGPDTAAMEHPTEPPHLHDQHAAGQPHGHGSGNGIEWEDDMVAVNRQTTTANMHWKFVDRTAGADREAINWQFTAGDRVKIRLVNEMDSDHPMHHPFHLHGAGRFLVLARDGVAEPNLVWKDTVLVRTGQTVDILFDVTNPGLWMAHCHIAEHMQSGMMFSFTVARPTAR